MAALSLSGVHRLIVRLGFGRLRGRARLSSPDPRYAEKVAAVAAARAEAEGSGGRVALVYQDEMTYYRRPDPAPDYARAGGKAPPADQGHGSNKRRRVIGALDARTGRLFCWQRSRAGRDVLGRFFRDLAAAYGEAEVVYVALDNWPVHFHPELVAGLPAKVRLLSLPTYAPWTNPIEKAWRKLRQEVLHMHRRKDDWPGLQADVQRWLDAHAAGSPELLRYVGLGTK